LKTCGNRFLYNESCAKDKSFTEEEKIPYREGEFKL